MIETVEIPEVILERAKEIVKNNEQGPGRFFRYTSIDNLARLLDQGHMEVSGVNEFNTLMSEKFNPGKRQPENVVTFNLLSAINDFLQPLEIFEKRLARGLMKGSVDEVMEILAGIEGELRQVDERFTGLQKVVQEASETKNTYPVIEYLKNLGGEGLMIELEKAGWGVEPYGAFSDLMPVSVGAPLGLAASDKIVVLELDFDNSEVTVPEDDRNNEHEVMVRSINLSNLRGVYSAKDKDELWQRLQAQYPEYFKKTSPEALGDFARNKPLSELLSELSIQA